MAPDLGKCSRPWRFVLVLVVVLDPEGCRRSFEDEDEDNDEHDSGPPSANPRNWEPCSE